MKKLLRMLIAVVLLTATFSSCKKDTAAQSKDYSLSVKDKTWWGTLTNAGETFQYYSVHFNGDKTLVWSQFSGDYPGTWAINNNKLTMTFTSPAVIVTADISDENKLLNITTNTANKVNTGVLVEDPNIPLENTAWKGAIVISGPFETSFLAGLGMALKIGNTSYLGSGYHRSPSGGAIRYTVPTTTITMFCVIASPTKMYGTYADYLHTWQATKQ